MPTPQRPSPFSRGLFRLLGSVRLAVPVVIGIAATLAYGTWYEARFGTPAVQRDIYRSGGFFLLLCFLAINLAVAALQRWPWQRRHAGFVMVHAGIITILTGGLLGAHVGVQGELVIPEGQTRDHLQLEERLLVVHQPNPGVHAVFPTAFEAQRWQHAPNTHFLMAAEGREYHLVVDQYLPNAVAEESVIEGVAGRPAVRVEATAGAQTQSVWLWARDPARSTAAWGPVRLAFLEAATPQALAALGRQPARVAPSERGTLVLTFPWGAPHRVPVAAALGRAIPLPNTPYTLTIQQYFSDLAVTPAGVTNRSDEPCNPAVLYTIADPHARDTQMALARVPNFAEAHGIAPRIPVHVTYEHPLADPPLPPNLLGLVRGPAGALTGLVTDAQARLLRRQPMAVGDTLTHPVLGVRLRLVEALAQAEPRVTYRNGATDAVNNPVLHLQVAGADGRATVWVPEGEPQTVAVDRHPMILDYRKREVPLPFAVTLVDFRKQTYPGTELAASFESEVELTDPARGTTLHRVISMNNPLTYRGYTLFQASYSETPVETTVLSVRKDPGVPFVYVGFLTVVGGLITMFYWKPGR